MRLTTTGMCLFLLGTTFGCQQGGSVTLESDDEKASYAIGYDLGQNLVVARNHLDLGALGAGIEDALADREQRLSAEEVQTVMAVFNETIRTEMEEENVAETARNLEEGAAYLAENEARDGVTTTASGLQYEVLREGDGARLAPTDRARIHYRGTLIDGTEFDSSYARDEPATFGVSDVIPGFSEGTSAHVRREPLPIRHPERYRVRPPGRTARHRTGRNAHLRGGAPSIYPSS